MAPSFSVCIPTLNAGRYLDELLPAIQAQSCQPAEILIIDSASTDDTVARAEAFGATVLRIDRRDFNHGATRQIGLERLETEVVLYLTQDALPTDPDAFDRLLASFGDPDTGMAYGRQLPRPGADLLESHARLFNYPPSSAVRRWSDRGRLGLRTVFCSNSFAAYRRSALLAAGGFKRDAYFAEDMMAAARLLEAGWSLAYEASACVVHSHAYSLAEEFRRAVDIGIFHSREPWLLETYGQASDLGRRFVLSELRLAARKAPWLLPRAVLRSAGKVAGYKLGRHHHRLPRRWLARLSAQPFYWRQTRPEPQQV